MRLGKVRMKPTPGPQLGLGLEAVHRALPVLDERQRGTRFLGLDVKRIINPPAATGMSFWSLNPYVGCEFGCSYCYARATHGWVTERSTVPLPEAPVIESTSEAFERAIYVKQNVALTLLRTLDPAQLAGSTLLIGTATDPYQPAERRFRVTRTVLETLCSYRGLTVSITTKSPLVARDIDVLSRLGEHNAVSVSISLITADAQLIRQLEPKTPLPHARLRGLQALAAAGIHTGLLIAPIVPRLTDSWSKLGALVAAAKEAGAAYAVGHPLRLAPVARAGFMPVLEREFPGLSAQYRARYGGRHSAGRDYIVALTRRLGALQQIHGFPKQGGRRRGRPDRSGSRTRPGPPAIPELALVSAS
ncbi:MAG: radical SAM protein [Gemmatimonadota bacterium]